MIRIFLSSLFVVLKLYKMKSLLVRLINELLCHLGKSKGGPCGISQAGTQAHDAKNAGMLVM